MGERWVHQPVSWRMEGAAILPQVGPRRPVPPALGLLSALGWILSALLWVSGRWSLVHHDTLIHSSRPILLSAAVSLLAWQLVIGVMLIPLGLPIASALWERSLWDPHGPGARVAYLGGFASVWTGFGAVAFLGDTQLHHAADRWAWLSAHPWLIAGALSALAGAYQLSALHHDYLSLCRDGPAWLARRYRPGVRAGLDLGGRHALHSVAWSWPLMVLGFAAGVGNLPWMAAVCGTLAIQCLTPEGDRVARPIGPILLALAVLILIHPPWLPSLL
jgi:predicted metal-binding membrane protein